MTACRFVDPKHWKDAGSQIGYVRKVLEAELDCEVSVRSKLRQLKTNNHDGQMAVRFAHHGNCKQNHEFDWLCYSELLKLKQNPLLKH